MKKCIVAIAVLVLSCSGAPTKKSAKKMTLQPSSRCFEGAYRTYDAQGQVLANTPLVTRYVVSTDRISIEEVELGQEPAQGAYEIERREADIELDGQILSGPVEVLADEIRIDVATKPGPISMRSRLVLTDSFATEHVHIQQPEGNGHLVQVLVRIDDARCDERMKLFAENGRTTHSRRAKELLETAVANRGTGEVALKFDWPKDLSARVWVDSSWNRDGEKHRSRTPFGLTTAPHPSGLVVQVESLFSDALEGVGPRLEKVVQLSDYLVYPMVVAPDGRVAGIYEYEKVSQTLAALFGPETPAPEGMLSREAMQAEARKLWDPLVGAWTSAELQIGRPYNTRTRLPQVLPTGGQAVVEATTEFVVWGHVACEPLAEEKKCVVVQLTQRTDPEYVREALRPFFEEKGEEPPELREFEQLFSTITVLDPDTLLPFEYHEVNSAKFVLVPAEGEPAESSKLDQKSMTFHYD